MDFDSIDELLRQAFSTRDRTAFTRGVDKLLKFANHFCAVAQMSPSTARGILGVSPHATDDEINRAYRKIAPRLHPDVNKDPAAATKLIELNQARDTLLYPERQGVAADILRHNEETQTVIHDILDKQQREADEWVADVEARKAVRDEWDDYMFGEITADKLKHPENIAKAPAVEMKRQKHRQKLERDKQRRAEQKKKKVAV